VTQNSDRLSDIISESIGDDLTDGTAVEAAATSEDEKPASRCILTSCSLTLELVKRQVWLQTH
jgi:hypothetical protein